MKIFTTPLPQVFLLEPAVFIDDRGHFLETWNARVFQELVGPIQFVQDNESSSHYGVVRGLHFQYGPYQQAKLVRAITGEIYDVAVDLRPQSPSFGQHYGVHLSGENKKQLFLPPGCAHGFAVLSSQALVSYKCDQFYSKEHEGGIRFDDPKLQINWQVPVDHVRLSAKDQQLPSFDNLRGKL